MRTTLRRSCNACARAKHSCDLRTPRCSRCIKRNVNCVYANEPLTSPSESSPPPSGSNVNGQLLSRNGSSASSAAAWNSRPPTSVSPGSITARLASSPDSAFDPFDSYPPTRLPRPLAQRLIQHFLSSVAFQYYPLDMNMTSNPFVVSWWPLALADPALFHVSLQTASLDEERRARKGFPVSELLMMDSVTLLRRSVEDSSSAFRTETLNSVVTLAAIEHGKGNVEASRMHIEGAKQMVKVRGGIAEIKRVNPLTARMVCWVALLVTGSPQFPVQDDSGLGNGVAPTAQWQLASTSANFTERIPGYLDVDSRITDILTRLRAIFHPPGAQALSNTEIHDLTCFIVHRLLLIPPLSSHPEASAVSECLRLGMVLHMLVIHGTTYYSHMDLAHAAASPLMDQIEVLSTMPHLYGPLRVWALSLGLVSTMGHLHQRFSDQAQMTIASLGLTTWDSITTQMKTVLWIETEEVEHFRLAWIDVLEGIATPDTFNLNLNAGT
ncbi:hypothetical protein B0I35DRAFT_215515 [Stachybotrys elegans]|uniref:Zn(2)-C6 fungal-type domain-containing protein n=1 Tax=Stachybotrys elegans TaxID=80388 RepID=A0A8K0WS83_9HYPO|nr:hypothetical protein B0I35DRAFT_215515 [Stachybotrys elegans]